VQQLSVAIKHFFTACDAHVALPWRGRLWREDMSGA
jgi:hypothetical protein